MNLLIPVILLIVPVIIGFKRGHNGYAVGAICLAAFIFSYSLGFIFKSNSVYLGMFFLIWFIVIVYCLLVKGESGDRLAIESKTIDSDSYEEEEIIVSDNDFVVVKTYSESWQQGELMEDIQKLVDEKIEYRSKSGVLACIMVKVKDFEKAKKSLKIDE